MGGEEKQENSQVHENAKKRKKEKKRKAWIDGADIVSNSSKWKISRNLLSAGRVVKSYLSFSGI